MTKTIQTEGEFAGWTYWPEEAFEAQTAGPFYMKADENGDIVSAFRAEEKHMNGGGVVHGGALMSFADFALFAISSKEKPDTYGLTVAFASEFLAGAKLGALMEARGEVLRAGRSIIFVRGIVTGDGEPVLNFSGTIKKIKPKSAS